MKLTSADALVVFAGVVVMLTLVAYLTIKCRTEERLWSVGFTNHVGNTPRFRYRYRKWGQPRLQVWVFENSGIPLITWEERRAKVEAALNITIVRLAYYRDKRKIKIVAVPAKEKLPAYLAWKKDLLSSKDFELLLGEDLFGRVSIDLSKIPHVMLGGASGSGKSVLLKLLLLQALRKEAEIYIADFKGGVDYPGVWHSCCQIVTEKENLLGCLDNIVAELEKRRGLLVAHECRNIEDYNANTEKRLPRIIFACDEIAEVLDKKGLSKEEKSLTEQIENRLSLIARQGRAFGIHLFLATQRPDADLISGQIRSNLGYRICGRADEILSRIVLESTAAAEKITAEDRGRFVLGDTVFQAYWMTDDSLLVDC